MHRVVATAIVAGCLALPASACAGTLFVIHGAGWGNGLGMSQWGAEGYAAHGWGYRQILAHYYPHTLLRLAADRPVRVLLAEKEKTIRIGSAAPFLVVDARGRKVHVPARTLTFGSRLQLARHRLVPPVTVEPGAQPLTLGGSAYRGALTLMRDTGTLSVVNTVSLELYLRGVVPSEMPGAWLAQAYEAQAVAARSYASASLQPTARFDLYADGRSQVYGGVAAEKPAANAAVAETAGEVLTYDGQIVRALYDSDSGGRTAAVEDVFQGSSPVPYLASVRDPYDSGSPFRHWRLTLDADELSTKLGAGIEDVRVEHGASGVVTHVTLVRKTGRTVLAADDFRQRLGLRSLRFSVSVLTLAGATKTSGNRLELRGFLRHVGGVVLQARRSNGSWQQVARVHARPDGRFALLVPRRAATAYRLAVDEVAGPPLPRLPELGSGQ